MSQQGLEQPYDAASLQLPAMFLTTSANAEQGERKGYVRKANNHRPKHDALFPDIDAMLDGIGSKATRSKDAVEEVDDWLNERRAEQHLQLGQLKIELKTKGSSHTEKPFKIPALQQLPSLGAASTKGDLGPRDGYRRNAGNHASAGDSLFQDATSGIRAVDEWLDEMHAEKPGRAPSQHRLPEVGTLRTKDDAQHSSVGNRVFSSKPLFQDIDSMLGGVGHVAERPKDAIAEVDEWLDKLRVEQNLQTGWQLQVRDTSHVEKKCAGPPLQLIAAAGTSSTGEDLEDAGPQPRNAYQRAVDHTSSQGDSPKAPATVRALRRSQLAALATASSAQASAPAAVVSAPLSARAALPGTAWASAAPPPQAVNPPSAPRLARPRPKLGAASRAASGSRGIVADAPAGESAPRSRLPWNADNGQFHSALSPRLACHVGSDAVSRPMPPSEPRCGRAAPGRRHLGHIGTMLVGGSGVATGEGSDQGSLPSDSSSFNSHVGSGSDRSRHPKAPACRSDDGPDCSRPRAKVGRPAERPSSDATSQSHESQSLPSFGSYSEATQMPHAAAGCSSSGIPRTRASEASISDEVVVESFGSHA